MISFFPHLFYPSTCETSIASCCFFGCCPCICVPEERSNDLQFFFYACNFFLYTSQQLGLLDKQVSQGFYCKFHCKLCHSSKPFSCSCHLKWMQCLIDVLRNQWIDKSVIIKKDYIINLQDYHISLLKNTLSM